VKIAFLGRMCSGKTECANYFVTKGFKKLSFAEPMKQDILELVQKRAPWVTRTFINENKSHFRTILQGYGTDTMKLLLGDDCWARIACEDASQYDSVVLDDMRFLIEAERWRKIGGIVVRLECPDLIRRRRHEELFGPVSTDDWLKMNSHQSETEVDLIQPDYTIHNSGDSIPQLHLILGDFLWRLSNASSQQGTHLRTTTQECGTMEKDTQGNP
jgi:dephospho-CoA kinase